jgi:hypothetical protein
MAMSWMKGRAVKICVLGDPGVGRAGQNVAAAISDFVVRHQRSWDVFERMPVGPSRFSRLWPEVGRFDRWAFTAGFWPGDPGPGGWPDPHGACVLGR